MLVSSSELEVDIRLASITTESPAKTLVSGTDRRMQCGLSRRSEEINSTWNSFQSFNRDQDIRLGMVVRHSYGFV